MKEHRQSNWRSERPRIAAETHEQVHARWGDDHSGHGWGGGRRRMRRGDIRRAVLTALQEGPAHGYEVMRRLEARTGGMWRPSPGSIYPTLQMLEDEGLVRSTEREGTRVYELTEPGRTTAAADAGGGWDRWTSGDGDASQVRAMRDAIVQSMKAAKEVATSGNADQIERAGEVLRRAKKELYQILGED